MNYKRIYEAIITQVKQRVNYSGYLENHHIIPKFLNGNDSQENLVKLTPKEHYLCHLLLTKFVPPSKTFAAVKSVYMMLAWSYTNENRVKCVAGLSRKIIRCKLPNMSDSTRFKISEATKRQFKDPEKRAKHLAAVIERFKDPLEIKKLSEAQKIRFESKDERLKISEGLKKFFKENQSPNKGRSFSHFTVEERKAKFGHKQKKGIKRSPESIEKMKAAWILRKQKKQENHITTTLSPR